MPDTTTWTKGAGWTPQLDDPNDLIYTKPASQKSPDSKDLRKDENVDALPFDQGMMNSCTANAIVAALKYGKNAAVYTPGTFYIPSRLFIYFHERYMSVTGGRVLPRDSLDTYLADNTNPSISVRPQRNIEGRYITDALKVDPGAQIRDGFKALKYYGVCKETTWPYMPTDVNAKDFIASASFFTPPKGALDEGQTYIDPGLSYYRIKDLAEDSSEDVVGNMESALAEGFPIVFGFWGSDANAPLWGAAKTASEQGLTDDWVYKGWVKDGDVIWGHAVTCVGYDHQKERFLILNSYGSKWGDGGYFWMPYGWFRNGTGEAAQPFTDDRGYKYGSRCDDIWVIKCQHPPAPLKTT